jgi:hypothetical protein
MTRGGCRAGLEEQTKMAFVQEHPHEHAPDNYNRSCNG